ncbi:hypothetical protein [Kytococcus sedentarius]|uniref:hypothetical protein n=1 Tax=Kytococcus sedentarius TaxID=1276 RepID=UPI0035BC7DF4
MNTSLQHPSTRLKRALHLSLLPLAALALSACGGEEETPAETESSVSSSTQEQNEETSAPAEESETSEDASAPAEETSAPAEETSAPEDTASAGDEETGNDAGEEPTTDPSLTRGGEGQSAELNITSFQDLEGIHTKVDELSAQDACGYLQGAMANPVSLETPATGAQGVQDLAKVAPPEVRGAIHALSTALAGASGPSDPNLGTQLGQVEEICMSAAG